MTGKMPSSPSISPPSSRASGSLMEKSSSVLSQRARWNLEPCGTVWSRKVCNTDSSCRLSSTRTVGPWLASAALVYKTQPPSPSKVGASGDLSGQIGSRHKSPIGRTCPVLFPFLTGRVRSIHNGLSLRAQRSREPVSTPMQHTGHPHYVR